MKNKVTDFPQYRKLSNEKVFYRIIDDRSFDEIQIIGSTSLLHNFVVNQYPDVLRLKDMIDLVLPGIEVSSEAEFNSKLSK